MLVRNNIVVEKIREVLKVEQKKLFECCAVQMKIKGETFAVCCVYRSPESSEVTKHKLNYIIIKVTY